MSKKAEKKKSKNEREAVARNSKISSPAFFFPYCLLFKKKEIKLAKNYYSLFFSIFFSYFSLINYYLFKLFCFFLIIFFFSFYFLFFFWSYETRNTHTDTKILLAINICKLQQQKKRHINNKAVNLSFLFAKKKGKK